VKDEPNDDQSKGSVQRLSKVQQHIQPTTQLANTKINKHQTQHQPLHNHYTTHTYNTIASCIFHSGVLLATPVLQVLFFV
jgi:hypothetical protein